MAQKKGKRKTQAGNSRGFATVSTPSKAKDQVENGDLDHVVNAALDTDNVIEPALSDLTTNIEGTQQDHASDEAAQVVESGTKLYNRLSGEIEVDKRSRKACIQLSLPEKSVERILNLGKDEHTDEIQELPEQESLKYLYAAELLLGKLGFTDQVIRDALIQAKNVSNMNDILYQLVLSTAEDIDFELSASSVKSLDVEKLTPESEPQDPSNGLSLSKSSRMTELLSDEEDQDELADSPTVFFVENHLKLLSLRARLKKDPSVQPQVTRLEKRSRVIEGQLGFDRKFAMKEIQHAIREGYLQKAADAFEIEENKISSAVSCRTPDVERERTQHFITTGEADREIEKLSTDQFEHSGPESTDQFEHSGLESTTSSSETSPEISLTVGADEEDLTLNQLFEDSSVAFKTEEESTISISIDKPLFPVILPKSSQNISPIKLLQTYLKRADKQASETFLVGDSQTLILRFSSSRVKRKRIIVEDHSYTFPDEDTARNFLSIKALFSVPELAAEKAISRFSGVFRLAWKILEDEKIEFQKNVIAKKIANVRHIYGLRPKAGKQYGTGECPESAIGTRSDKTERVFLRDTPDDMVEHLWSGLCETQAYHEMRQYRQTLPIAAFRNELIDAITNNQVIILCGETGCGKSTQLPTFILEHQLANHQPCKIYVTEPRRISAISLATRVSSELGEHHRAIASGNSLLGFSIRLDSQVSEKSRLVYATTGIVLRMLEGNGSLREITHLVIDEVHERSIESDFLLIVIKRLLKSRRDLKVVLMSATLQADRFNDFFGGHCCIFNIPGRTHPVQQFFLEDAIERSGYICDENGPFVRRERNNDQSNDWELPDDHDGELADDDDLVTYTERTIRAVRILDPYKVNYDLICTLLDQLETEPDKSITQAILVFLPGIGEIRRLFDTLQAHNVFGNQRNWFIYALHSSISSEKQQAAFDIPPRGVRKIVIATNIAETGITIPDITCVIDAGKHKESRFDARRQLSKLVETFISKANARQRMGRAGRVQPGICFHLFSKARYGRMAEHQLPEFQRLNLDELALRVKTVQMGGIEEILLEALDAPTPENVKRSIANLIQVGALDDNENLTPLGRHLAKLPVDATLGKLILYGVKYSCLDPCLVIAAVLSSKSPFDSPMGQQREAALARQAFARGESDFLTMWTAYCKWREVCQTRNQNEQKYCRDSYLSMKGLAAIEELRLQYAKILVESGLLQISDQEGRAIQRARFISSRDGFVRLPDNLGLNNHSPTLIEACIAAAFYPNLINVEDGFKTIAKGQAVTLHPSSVNRHNQVFSKRWIVFYSLLKTKSATNAHDTGLVDDYIVALFCGSHTDVRPFSGTLNIDHNRVRFKTRKLRTLVAITLLRQNIEREFAAFLDRKEFNPEWFQILEEIVSSFEMVAKQKLR